MRYAEYMFENPKLLLSISPYCCISSVEAVHDKHFSEKTMTKRERAAQRSICIEDGSRVAIPR